MAPLKRRMLRDEIDLHGRPDAIYCQLAKDRQLVQTNRQGASAGPSESDKRPLFAAMQILQQAGPKQPYKEKRKTTVRFKEAIEIIVVDEYAPEKNGAGIVDNLTIPEQRIDMKTVSSFLRALTDAFSDPEFQVELQILLLHARESEGLDQMRGLVPGLANLIAKVHGEVSGDFTSTRGTSMYKLITPFVMEDDVLKWLSVMDELLALPPNTLLEYVKQA